MKIKYIELENIRSYEHQKIEFEDGTSLLKGDIGAGKSSILYALEFGLFGVVNNINLNSLLRKGKESGKVTISFEVKGSTVTIERNMNIKRNKIVQAEPIFTINGITNTFSITETKAKVFKLLNYNNDFLIGKNFDLFRYTIYTPQEEMKKILLSKGEDRLVILRKLFNLDQCDIMSNNIAVYLKELKNKIFIEKELSNGIDDLKKDKEEFLLDIEFFSSLGDEYKETMVLETKKLDEINEKFAVINEQINELTHERVIKQHLEITIKGHKIDIENITARIKTLHDKVDNNDIKGHKIEAAKTELNLMDFPKETKEELKESIVKLQDIKLCNRFIEKGIKELSEDYKVKIDEFTTLKQKVLEQTNLIDSTTNSLCLYDQTFLEYSLGDLDTRENILNTLDDAKNKVKIEIEFSKEDLKKLELKEDEMQNISYCPKCRQPINDEIREHIHEQNIEELNFLLSKSAKAKALLEKTNFSYGLLINIDHSYRYKALLDLNIASIEKDIKEIDLERTNKEKQIHPGIDDQISVIEQKQEVLDAHNKLEDLKSFLMSENSTNEKAIEKEKAILEAKNKDYKLNLAEYKAILTHINLLKTLELETELKDLKSLRVKAKMSIEALNTEELTNKLRITGFETKLKIVEETILNKNGHLKLRNKLNKDSNFLNKIVLPLLVKIDKQIRTGVYNEFNFLYRKWFKMLIEDVNITTNLREDFSPIVSENGYEIEFANLSGGEKTSCSLAYRLALNNVLNSHYGLSNGLLILDEPTDGFSKKQLDKVRNIIFELKNQQIILVSHEEEIESFVDRIMNIVKINNKSKIL